MGYLIGLFVVGYLLYLLIIHVIIPFLNVMLPITGYLLSVSFMIGVICALYLSVRSFGQSWFDHRNPYTTYIDQNPKAPDGVRRNYFFGPGYHQIVVTVKDAFAGQANYIEALIEWRKKHTDHPWYISMWVWVFYIAAYLCTFIFGLLWTTVFSIALFAVIFAGMCCYYCAFSVLWSLDRLSLAIQAIHSRCPDCKRKSVIPVFLCPDCGREHKQLAPGPYGIFIRKCVCGQRLPTTIFNGRSKLDAICPFCMSGLAASDARQLGIQLVGGTGAGKTTFLAAFWHQYLEQLERFKAIGYKKFPPAAFDDLEFWYQQGLSAATNATNANMFSIIHTIPKQAPCQLTIYDIGGEVFAGKSYTRQQQQFRYCEGIIIVIDPTAAANVTIDAISSFINEFDKLQRVSSRKTTSLPVAVVISKADLFKSEIGFPKIKASHRTIQRQCKENVAPPPYSMTCNRICREFLRRRNLDSLLGLLDSKYDHMRFFPISAMGHSDAILAPYQPWGVIEPVYWILHQVDASFHALITY